MALLMPPQAQAAAQELTSDFVYKYLVGEVAGQRGDVGLASSLFYDLAKSSRDARMAERATRAAAYAKQQQLALKSGALWAELDPDSVEAQQAMAQMLMSAGKLEEATPYLQKLLTKEDTRVNGFNYLHGILAGHPDKAAAFQLIQKLAAPYGTLPEARLTVAHIAWNAGQDTLAMQELKIAEDLRPGWPIAAMLHGEILHKQSPDKAIDFYRQFLARYPAANDVRLGYAKLLVNQRMLNEARNEFTRLADASDGSPDVSVVIGLLSGQLGDYRQADAYFQQALDRGYKDSDQLYIYLGQSAEKQNRLDEALDWYGRISQENHLFDAKIRIAGVLASQQKLEEARKVLHELPNLDNEQLAMAAQIEANLLAQAKRHQEAFDLLANAIASLPNSSGLVYDYAMLAEKLQRFDIMERELRKLIAMNPDYAEAYNALGYTLADRNERLGEAVTLIQKALELSPDNHYILDSMGWVQYRMGKLDEAADYLRRAYNVQTDPEIAAHLGEVLWQQGKRDEAVKTWEEALREHPDNDLLLDTTKKFSR